MAKKPKITTKVQKGINKIINLTDKFNPLNEKVDKSTVTDTGKESLKQVNSGIRTVKSSVRTVKSTVKTTKRTVKAVKNIPKNIKRTAKITVKVVKVAVKIFKAAVNVISKVIAFLISNPVVLLIILVIALVIYLITAFQVLIAGAAGGEATTKHSFSEAGGLDDVPEQLKKGVEIVKKCREDIKKEYDKWIDNLYYDDNNDNKRKSDLVYMERFDKDDNATQYQKAFADSGVKQTLKEALDWNKGIDDVDILSIAYVLSEKEKNNSRKEYQINLTEYTDELIKKVTDKIVSYYDSHVYENQLCPDRNCYQRKEKNPEWDRANGAQDKLLRAYNEWTNNIEPLLIEHSKLPGAAQAVYWENNIGWRLSNWEYIYASDDAYGKFYPDTSNNGANFNNVLYQAYRDWWNYWVSLPEYTETSACDSNHKYYSKGLEFFSKDEIITMLGFDDTEKIWEQYTEIYIRSLYETP